MEKKTLVAYDMSLEDWIDSYLLTASFSLLLVFTFVFQANPPKNQLEIYASTASVVFLFIAFFTLLWHKYRRPYRMAIFEKKRKQIIKKHAGKIANFIENVVRPFTKLQVSNEVSKAKNKEEAISIIKKMEKEVDESSQVERLYGYIIKSFVNNINNDMKEAYKASFQKPLEEKGAKIKHFLDNISLRIRYYVFTIGSISFLISVVARLIG